MENVTTEQRVYGRGQHSHDVPLRDGQVVEMRDGGHAGTGVYWSEARERYVFASYDSGHGVAEAERCVLVCGQDVEALHGAFACDLDSPRGLALVGIETEDDLSWLSEGAEVLWDSAEAEPVHCECGRTLGVRCQWTGPRSETVVVEWMPESLRASHVAAGNRGVYPHNGAERLRVEASCADRIVTADGDWSSIVEESAT